MSWVRTTTVALTTILVSLAVVFSVEAGPSVVSHLPTQNEVSVLKSAHIHISFSAALDTTSIDQSSVVIYGRSTGYHDFEYLYNDATSAVTLDPTTDFARGELVTVIVTPAIRGAGGADQAEPFQWSFMTAAVCGSFAFTSGGTFPVSTWPHTVFAARLDNDHLIDLFTAQTVTVDVSVLLNAGGAVFSDSVNYPIAGGSRCGIAFDVDSDGDIDLATANTYGGSNTVSIRYNNSFGVFDSTQSFQSGLNPYSIAAGDVNSDGLLDIVVANSVSGEISILTNQGSGAFSGPSSYPAVLFARSICTGDLDNDGDLDIATVGGTTGGTLAVFANDGSGLLGTASTYSLKNSPWSAVMGDLNGDGYLDIATVNRDSDTLSVLFNDGSGVFAARAEYSTGGAPVSINVADFDADGDLDVIVTNDDGNSVGLYANDGQGALALVGEQDGYSRAYSSFPADYDEDGDIDIAIANLGDNSVSIMLNFESCSLCCTQRGDINSIGGVNIADLTYMVTYVFKGGSPPLCLDEGDVDASGGIDIADVTYLVAYMFKSGPEPVGCP